jgi:hypothetical protein
LRPILYAAVICVLGVGTAVAQDVPTHIGPGKKAAPKPTPTPDSGSSGSGSTAPEPYVITIGPDGKPIEPTVEEPDTSGLYHYDGDDAAALYGTDHQINAGPTPELHVVRRGDTLWDICWYYFNDPWQWPKVWSFNAQITNPHWIYPGDLVRLLPGGFTDGTQPLPDEDVEGTDDFEPPPAKRYEVSLKQTAYVDQDQLDDTIVIDGSVDDKELLATDDVVYLSYPDGHPPKVGATYSIYERGDAVEHPRTGKPAGAYVRILGELEVTSVKKDKRARGVITAATREIERGDLVGPLIRTLKTVPPTPNKVDAQGTIVAMLSDAEIMGSGEVVFVDLGEGSGVEVGNRMYVVRRGDALQEDEALSSTVGQDDRRFPARALGELVIVDVGKTVSIGLITLSVREMGVGDLVMMQKSPE